MFNVDNVALSLIDVIIDGDNIQNSNSMIQLHSAILSINNSIIKNANSNVDGSIIEASNQSKINIENSSITNNKTSENGGAIYMDSNSIMDITNSYISANQSGKNGGFLYAEISNKINVYDSQIDENIALGNGGAMYLSNSKIEVINSKLNGNRANDGGAFYILNAIYYPSIDARPSFRGMVVENNHAVGENSKGGGIYSKNQIIVTDSKIIDNSATFGHEVYLDDVYGDALISYRSVFGGQSNADNYGIYVTGGFRPGVYLLDHGVSNTIIFLNDKGRLVLDRTLNDMPNENKIKLAISGNAENRQLIDFMSGANMNINDHMDKIELQFDEDNKYNWIVNDDGLVLIRKNQIIFNIDSNKGSNIVGKVIQYIDNGIMPDEPRFNINEGYKFKGWDKDIQVENGDMQYTAIFDLIDYHIAYELDGASIDNPTTYNVETNDFTLDNPSKDGYTFLGWSKNNSTNINLNETITKGSSGDIFFKAIWELNRYDISFEIDTLKGQSEDALQLKIDYDSMPTIPKVNANNGYKFIGWDKDVTKVTADANYVALFDLVDYKLTYDLHGGNAFNPLSYNVETDTFVLNNPVKDGYTFLGWQRNNDKDIILNTSVLKGSYGDIKFSALWKKDSTNQQISDELPNTKDNSNNLLWIALLILSSTILLIIKKVVKN